MKKKKKQSCSCASQNQACNVCEPCTKPVECEPISSCKPCPTNKKTYGFLCRVSLWRL